MTTLNGSATPASMRRFGRLLWPAIAGLGVLLLSPLRHLAEPGQRALARLSRAPDACGLRPRAGRLVGRARGRSRRRGRPGPGPPPSPSRPRRPPRRRRSPPPDGELLRRVDRTLTLRILLSLAAGFATFRWAAQSPAVFPRSAKTPLLDLIALHDPAVHALFRGWYLAVPGLLAFGAVLLLSGARRVWLESRPEPGRHGRGLLPPWPASPDDEAPSLVLGELHHPIEPKEIPQPEWLTIPERGLYTASPSSAPSAPAKPADACGPSPNSSSPGKPTIRNAEPPASSSR